MQGPTQHIKTAKPREDAPQCCGKCRYPVRGISSLTCPECGADLRLVGTVTLGSKSVAVIGCLFPLLFTVGVIVLAIALFAFLAPMLPTYSRYEISADFQPTSAEYDMVEFWARAHAITPGGISSQAGISTSTSYNGAAQVNASLDLFSNSTTFDLDDVALIFSPKASSPAVGSRWHFNIDPNTREAQWLDPTTRTTHQSNGPFTEQDILTCIGMLGADTTRTDVILEAQALYNLIDGVLNRQNQFQISGFVSLGSGYGGSSRPGPTWAILTYWGAWFVIWLVGLIFLVRRAKRWA